MTPSCFTVFLLFAIFHAIQAEKIKNLFVTFANCDDNSVIRFDKGFSMYVDNEYSARIRGCLSADSFEEAEVLVKVKNYESAPWDICSKPERKGPQFELVKMLHDALGLDFECPFRKMRNCMDNVIDMRRYRRYLKLLPKFKRILLNFKHGDDKISCIAVKTNAYNDKDDEEEDQE